MSTPETARLGPCAPWITGTDVLVACDPLDSSGDPSVYDDAALEASQILFELSGRQFRGECGPITVRPCAPGCSCWLASPPLSAGVAGWPWGSWGLGGTWGEGWGWTGAGWGWEGSSTWGCSPVSRVKLAGYPVREVLEVSIAGQTVDPSGYRLDKWKYLTRLADTDGTFRRWPGCQRLDRDDGEPGTWSVTYTFGQDPPKAGRRAAQALACQLAIFDGGGDCDLPPGTKRIVRQGMTVDLENTIGVWWEVIPQVSSFLATYNPQRLRRRAAVWSPDIAPFGKKVGT